jgi:hypothetical protein
MENILTFSSKNIAIEILPIPQSQFLNIFVYFVFVFVVILVYNNNVQLFVMVYDCLCK